MNVPKRIATMTLALALATSPAMALVGCGGSSSDAQSDASVESKDGIDLGIVNALGSDVTVLAIRKSGEQAWGDNLLSDGATMPVGAEMQLSLASGDGSTYELRAATVEGSYEFVDLPLEEIALITLHEEDGATYVDYETISGEQVSTREAALALKAEQEALAVAEEAAAKAEAEAAAEAEAVAGEEAEAEPPASWADTSEEYYEESSDEWVDDSYDDGSYDDGGYEEYYEDVAQSEDECLDDVAWKD